MATYEQIIIWVKEKYRFTPKPCWIAHVKELCGLELRQAPNRINPNKREEECPPNHIRPIKVAFRHFKMI
ncbi:MAG: hypothetical protein ABSA18_11600 [Dehalococcoidia bacterium]|jgi:hypothetical protein